jgi:hypothetical protein
VGVLLDVVAGVVELGHGRVRQGLAPFLENRGRESRAAHRPHDPRGLGAEVLLGFANIPAGNSASRCSATNANTLPAGISSRHISHTSGPADSPARSPCMPTTLPADAAPRQNQARFSADFQAGGTGKRTVLTGASRGIWSSHGEVGARGEDRTGGVMSYVTVGTENRRHRGLLRRSRQRPACGAPSRLPAKPAFLGTQERVLHLPRMNLPTVLVHGSENRMLPCETAAKRWPA